MKKLLAACLLGLLPTLALAQAPNLDAPPKPKPIQPIIASQHSGPGRIGVRLAFDKVTGLPQIVGMIRGGPAADYGFQIGDIIIKIDHNFTNSLTQDEVKLALHGEPGTGVELTIQRGDDPRLIVRAIERRELSANAEDIIPDSTVITDTQPNAH
jgi:C-terminal processing protease CtpA/Prc